MENLANAQRRFDAALPSDFPARQDETEFCPPENPPAGAIITRSHMWMDEDSIRGGRIQAALSDERRAAARHREMLAVVAYHAAKRRSQS